MCIHSNWRNLPLLASLHIEYRQAKKTDLRSLPLPPQTVHGPSSRKLNEQGVLCDGADWSRTRLAGGSSWMRQQTATDRGEEPEIIMYRMSLSLSLSPPPHLPHLLFSFLPNLWRFPSSTLFGLSCSFFWVEISSLRPLPCSFCGEPEQLCQQKKGDKNQINF